MIWANIITGFFAVTLIVGFLVIVVALARLTVEDWRDQYGRCRDCRIKRKYMDTGAHLERCVRPSRIQRSLDAELAATIAAGTHYVKGADA